VTHFIDGQGIHSFKVKGATEIDVLTAKSLHDSGVTFVDARPEKNRNKEGWIPRSVSLPEPRSNNPNNRRLTEKTLMNILDKTDEVVFYSAGLIDADAFFSAYASAKAVNWGYQNVFHFWGIQNWRKEGGFLGWKEAGYPVETEK
jgi:rhodanese-related sulfurtransferase